MLAIQVKMFCMFGECELCLTSNLSDFDEEKKTISFLNRELVHKNIAKLTKVFLLIKLLRNGILLYLQLKNISTKSKISGILQPAKVRFENRRGTHPC